MKVILYLFVFSLLLLNKGICQYVVPSNNPKDIVSIYNYASIADARQNDFNINDIINSKAGLNYEPVSNENENIGFTNNHYWVKFTISNPTSQQISYYLETARPITDHADLYTINNDGSVHTEKSGDDMPFWMRSFDHRKTIFLLSLPAHSSLRYFLHLKSDGEVLTLPLTLRSYENLLHITYLEQLVFGFFYGILLLAAIIYLFFYFGMRDKSFLNYSLYVIFIALMQFSLDGYFYEYITPGGGWFSLHSVLIFASFAAFFLGRYSELFLNVQQYVPAISKVYRCLYILIGISFFLLLFIPKYFRYAYPITNLFGMIILFLIIISIIYLNYKKLPADNFFTTGILFLIAGFVLFILNNFNFIPITFLSQNSSKLGTGMEVIFISLSMANRIRRLREEREALIDDLTVSNHDLKQFTYITSHDLRAPISNLMGLVTLYNNEATNNPRNKIVIEKIAESTKRLNDTVSDLINILLIKNNSEIAQQMVRFSDVFNKAMMEINTNMISYDISIQTNFSQAEAVYFNQDYLESIFLNLITNAIKYKSENRPLVVEIKSRVKDHSVQLMITDNGSGMDLKRHKDKIFGMHQRFHSNADSKGVGLYIIKSQINSLGGQINAESEVNEGTTFTITFRKHIE